MFSLPVLMALLPMTQAISWLYAPLWQREGRATASQEQDDALPPEELAAILKGSKSLAAYSHRPDCFRRAADMIQTRCGDLETNEAERVRAALSMTLCEIATADHHSIPMECTAFQSDIAETMDYRFEPPGKCVSALSRSAQYWSSYSGYLREVSQLCFAFRRWNDIDTAKEVHRNATLEAIAVLRYTTYREEKMKAAWEESHALLGTMRTVLHQMHASSDAIDVASGAAAGNLSLSLNEMVVAFRGILLDLHEHAVHEHAHILTKLGANISQAVDQLRVVTTSAAPTLERLFIQTTDAAYAHMAHHLQRIDSLANQASSSLVNFQQMFDNLQHTTTLLIGDVEQASADLQVSLLDSHMAHEKQVETVKTAENVSVALSQLVVRAQMGMQDLNVTIAEMKGTLSKDAYSDWTTSFWFLFQAGLMHILKVQPGFFDHPLSHALYSSARGLRTLLFFASSGIVSIMLLLTSVRDLFSRRRHAERASSGNTSSLVVSDIAQTRARFAASVTQSQYLDVAHPRVSGKASGAESGQSYGTPVPRRPTRPSRIPDRLCRTIF